MSAIKAEKAPRIVAGVDGSVSSPAAPRWAVHQAELSGGTVDAVVAWQTPATRCPVAIVRGDLARAA